MRSKRVGSRSIGAAAWLAVSPLVAWPVAGWAGPNTAAQTSAAAPGSAAPAPAASASAMVAPRVTEAWIRWLPGDLPAAAYLTVNNPGAAAIFLLGASSADYADVSLHRNEMHEGSMQMLPLDRLEIPARTTLRFEALGYHLMLMRGTKPIKPGDHVTLNLRFASAPPMPVVFEVRKPDGSRAD